MAECPRQRSNTVESDCSIGPGDLNYDHLTTARGGAALYEYNITHISDSEDSTDGGPALGARCGPALDQSAVDTSGYVSQDVTLNIDQSNPTQESGSGSEPVLETGAAQDLIWEDNYIEEETTAVDLVHLDTENLVPVATDLTAMEQRQNVTEPEFVLDMSHLDLGATPLPPAPAPPQGFMARLQGLMSRLNAHLECFDDDEIVVHDYDDLSVW